jgi:hypothetical protein
MPDKFKLATNISSFLLAAGFEPQSKDGGCVGVGDGDGTGEGPGVGCNKGTGSSPVLAKTTRVPSIEIVGFLL